MNNDLLRLIEKNTDTLIEQTKTKLQESLEFQKDIQLISFPSSINLIEEWEWSLAVTVFEANNSVFIIYYENNSFSSPRQDIS